MGPSNTSISKMEKLQNKALRIISYKHTRSSVNPLYSKCEILKFADNIKLSNFYLHIILSKVIYQHHYVIVLHL